jgi:hypothetical protein
MTPLFLHPIKQLIGYFINLFQAKGQIKHKEGAILIPWRIRDELMKIN